MDYEHYAWLLPAWLIGMPFLVGLVEYFRLPRHKQGLP